MPFHLQGRPANLRDASLLFELYCATPKYFDVLSAPMPTQHEVTRELEIALQDPKRRVELLFEGSAIVGLLDYKLDYPDPGDATINLLLIRESEQSKGYGTTAMALLEGQLKGSSSRILASVYGGNVRAKKFWKKLGYEFAIDARPVVCWYAKAL